MRNVSRKDGAMEQLSPSLFDLPDLPPASPRHLQPPSWRDDPQTAKEAANSKEARRAVVQGTARCLLLLHNTANGFTDPEVIEVYIKTYPKDVAIRGIVGLSAMVSRNWRMLKPNEDKRNFKKQNLNLIHRTEKTRLNPRTNKPNVVFDFITSPTIAQLEDWRVLAKDTSE